MINELVQRFKIHLGEDGKSVQTIEGYVGDTSAFVVFPEGKGIDFNGEMKRFYIQNDEKVSKRNRMIILLLLYTGLRVSELCDIKAKNIDFLTAQLKVFGKGGKVREVPLKSEMEYILKLIKIAKV